MQRIICRYRKDASAASLSHSDLRTLFLGAVEMAGLPVEDGRRALVLGPPLPPGATSEAERLVLELVEPRDPAEVRDRLNECLPPGVRLEQAWIARGSSEDTPAHLDEAVYLVTWTAAPPATELADRLARFLAATEVTLTRLREKKTQQLNARALVYAVRLLEVREGTAHLQMTLSVGPQGSLRPDEFLQVLGYAPAPETVHVHRVALHQSNWRRPALLKRGARYA